MDRKEEDALDPKVEEVVEGAEDQKDEEDADNPMDVPVSLSYLSLNFSTHGSTKLSYTLTLENRLWWWRPGWKWTSTQIGKSTQAATNTLCSSS